MRPSSGTGKAAFVFLEIHSPRPPLCSVGLSDLMTSLGPFTHVRDFAGLEIGVGFPVALRGG